MGIALENEQKIREAKMIEDGRTRFNNKVNKSKVTSLTSNEAHSLIKDAFSDVEENLSKLMTYQSELREQRRMKGISECLKLDTSILSYIGLNSCWDAAMLGTTYTTLLARIGHKIELEIWASGLKEFDSYFATGLEAEVSKTSNPEHYKIFEAKRRAAKKGYTVEEWDDAKRSLAAQHVLNAVLEATNLFEIFDGGTPQKTRRQLGLTPFSRDALHQKLFDASWAEPALGPMITPPRPWTWTDTGCYLDVMLAQATPLVKKASFRQNKAIEEDFKLYGLENKVPPYVEALNAVQATPLRINKYVRDAVEWAWENDKVFGKFPTKVSQVIPEVPLDDYELMTPQERYDLQTMRRSTRTSNRGVDVDITVMNQDLRTAEELLEKDVFYIPWNFDFRGRMYPISHFNYHRDDHIRSMIELGHGKPLGPDGPGWLAVHIANCGDFDKISKRPLEERAAWTEENTSMIVACGSDFKSTFKIWSKADKPFAFLAACQAYVGYLDQAEKYVCHISPNLDGSNSGIQHFSAMMLSRDDGALVNLVKTEAIADVYQLVADEVVKTLQANLDDPMAKKWLSFGVDRKTIKRNCMTYGYSSGQYGMADQLFADLMRPLDTERRNGLRAEHPFGSQSSQEKHCQFLAKLSFTSIEKVVTSVRDGMKFIQSAASALAHEGKHLSWRTPIGFPVYQNYTQWTQEKIRPYLYDRELKVRKRVTVTLRTKKVGDRKVDKRKSKAACSANFVHSFDSAHMGATILQMLDHNIKDMMVIHDSFSTSCNQTWDLYHHVRHTFVDQYAQACVMSEFRRQVIGQLDAPDTKRLLPVPQKGTLDLTEVLESEFCFS
jgi:DNA-directed RNA polymerase